MAFRWHDPSHSWCDIIYITVLRTHQIHYPAVLRVSGKMWIVQTIFRAETTEKIHYVQKQESVSTYLKPYARGIKNKKTNQKTSML